jgi:hypothetical protein
MDWAELGLTVQNLVPNVVTEIIFLLFTYLIIDRLLKQHEERQAAYRWSDPRKATIRTLERDIAVLRKHLTEIAQNGNLRISPEDLVTCVDFLHDDLQHMLYASEPLIEPKLQLTLIRFEYAVRMLRRQLEGWHSVPTDKYTAFQTHLVTILRTDYEILSDSDVPAPLTRATGILSQTLEAAADDLLRAIKEVALGAT